MARTYVITGSGSGIGAVTAETLRKKGETVIGVDLKNADITADLGSAEGRQEAVSAVLDATGGKIDAVIACAGISAPKALTVAVNFYGVTELLDGLQPALAKAEHPRAAVISSMASVQPNDADLVEALLSKDEETALEIGRKLEAQGDEIGYLNYPSSKRAISKWVRRESITEKWAGAGIPLNAVAPGVVLTPMTEGLLSTEEGKAMVDAATPMPLNSYQSAQTVADLLIWLSSVKNSHLCGQTIYCDGGAEVVLRSDDVWSFAD